MPDTSELVSWSGLLLVLGVPAIILGWLGARALKRRLLRHQSSEQPFTIQDLRDMRSRGQITEQEFEAMRAAVLQQFDSDASAQSPGGPEPNHAEDDHPSTPPPE